jgi:hypothetical protein
MNDPTLRRIIGFANRQRAGGVLLTNAFGFRTTDPAELKRQADPVGPENDMWLRRASEEGPMVLAWGNHGSFLSRSSLVRNLFPYKQLFCFGYTKAGEPKHPLYLPYDSRLVAYGVGEPGIRDGEFPCPRFRPGRPEGDCGSDGHYLCRKCIERKVEDAESA